MVSVGAGEDVAEGAEAVVAVAVAVLVERREVKARIARGRTRTRPVAGTTTASEAMTRRWRGWAVRADV